ncbi:MAG: hypothetical protein ACI9EF_002061 [Pseudohongiellaceae bacterium]|jgi:hypothetical protein
MSTTRPGADKGARLTPQKKALLARLMAKKGLNAPAAEQPIARRNGTGHAPLTFAQEALWFLDQLEPDQANHNQPGAVRLAGQLDVRALERALGEIVSRHEALRSSFSVADGIPFQQIAPASPWTLAVRDLTGHPVPETEALRLATADSHLPFDLEQGPLFRSFLMKLGDRQHILVLNFHHIVTDGWSMGVFTTELQALYAAFRAGQPSPLAELPIQMPDYATWQRQTFQGAKLDEHLSYWKEQLKGELHGVTLPGDHPRPAVQSYQGRHASISLSAQLSDHLRTLSKKQGVTLFMTLEAAFMAVLFDACRETDMVIGSAVAHRNRKELEPIIGFLVNMLVMRADLSGDPGFDELLKRVRAVTIGAWTHQDLPLAHILREVQPDRDLGKNPLFQVQFSLLTPDRNPAVYGYGLDMGDVEQVMLDDLQMKPVQIAFDNARYDVAVFLWDMPDGIRGTLEYSSDLYEPATIARFVKRYETVLRAVVKQPSITLSALVSQLEQGDRDHRAAAENTFKSSVKSKLKGLKRRRSGTSPKARPGEPS